jgi:uncharacterized integral membrane protein
MNWKMIKGYVAIILGGLFLAACVIVFLSNARQGCQVWFFGKGCDAYVSIVMLASAVVGVVAIFMAKLLFHGIRNLREGRRDAQLRKVDQLEKANRKTESNP